MKLKEYLNQEDPKRLPKFSVGIMPSECEVYEHKYLFAGGIEIVKNVSIKMFDKWFCYACNESGNLYTTDSDGNKLSPSVFKLVL